MAFKKLFRRKSKPLFPVPSNNTGNISGCFDCNICLDFVHDPVVTLCGHLYCWSCIYEWFNVQSTSLAPDGHPQCPVCKAEISLTTVVPLYGRGQSPSRSGNSHGTQAPSIPPRPPAYDPRAPLNATPLETASQQLPFQDPYPGGGNQYYTPHEQASSSSFTHVGSPSPRVVHPVLEMLVDMMFTRAFGNSSRNLYSVQNAYHRAMTPRLIRQEVLAYKSLNRISLFFFCCILLCLFLF